MKNIINLSVLCLIWGINWVAIKISLEGFPPLTCAAVRFIITAAFMIVYVKVIKLPVSVNRRDFRVLLIAAFFTYAIDYGLIFWGEQYLSAGVTAIFFSTFVIFTALFSNFIFRSESFSWKKFTGLLVGFSGIVVVYLDQLLLTSFSHTVTLASAAVIVGGMAAAAATVIIKKFLSHPHPTVITYHQTWMGAAFLSLIALAMENPLDVRITPRVIWAMLYMSILASAVAFIIYYKLLKSMSAVSLSVIVYIIPLIALGADFLLLGEVIHWRSVLGMGIIFLGIWLTRSMKSALPPEPVGESGVSGKVSF